MSRGFTIAIVASVVALAMAVAGMAAYVFLKPVPKALVQPAPVAAPVDSAAPDAAVFKMKNFVTDLADQNPLRYVDVTVSLGLVDAPALDQAKQMEPRIRDVVLGHLRGKAAAELAGPAGKEKLTADLTQGLTALLKQRLVRVYITDMVIQ